GPVAVEPGFDEGLGARCLQAGDVVVAEVFVVGYFRRDKNTLETAGWIGNDLPALRCMIDVTGTHPVVSRSSWIGGKSQSNRNTTTATQSSHELKNRLRIRKVTNFFYIHSRIRVPLVCVCIAVPL